VARARRRSQDDGAELIHRLTVAPGRAVRLRELDPGSTEGFEGSKRDGLAIASKLTEKLEHFQELLYADRRHAVLVVLQGLDTSGKDGTIRRVFEGVNPQGVRVAQFRRPTPEEASHDYLWRVHRETPAKGEIVIFNRSHYEDVLAARVDRLVPPSVWKRRYSEINEFERTLVNEGTLVLKFLLHISEEEQKRRLQDRLDDPTKHWKFSESDLPERRRWPQYVIAYEDAVNQTSTAWAPWIVVPSDRKWFRDLVVSTALVNALAGLDMRWPRLPRKFRDVVVR
jgi:PPK2 family polyphosphate:nucleotide phosphotransferase